MESTNNQPTRVERVKQPTRMYANPVERERLLVERAIAQINNQVKKNALYI